MAANEVTTRTSPKADGNAQAHIILRGNPYPNEPARMRLASEREALRIKLFLDAVSYS
jgi:3-deoxy-D-arabino-heptulosonate 7-phosphate (DAHP) synthase